MMMWCVRVLVTLTMVEGRVVEVGAVGCWAGTEGRGHDRALSTMSSQVDLASASELRVEE